MLIGSLSKLEVQINLQEKKTPHHYPFAPQSAGLGTAECVVEVKLPRFVDDVVVYNISGGSDIVSHSPNGGPQYYEGTQLPNVDAASLASDEGTDLKSDRATNANPLISHFNVSRSNGEPTGWSLTATTNLGFEIQLSSDEADVGFEGLSENDASDDDNFNERN